MDQLQHPPPFPEEKFFDLEKWILPDVGKMVVALFVSLLWIEGKRISNQNSVET